MYDVITAHEYTLSLMDGSDIPPFITIANKVIKV